MQAMLSISWLDLHISQFYYYVDQKEKKRKRPTCNAQRPVPVFIDPVRKSLVKAENKINFLGAVHAISTFCGSNYTLE